MSPYVPLRPFLAAPSTKFCPTRTRSEFDEYIEFSERLEENGTKYRSLTITLQPVVGGNAHTHPLAGGVRAEPDDSVPPR